MPKGLIVPPGPAVALIVYVLRVNEAVTVLLFCNITLQVLPELTLQPDHVTYEPSAGVAVNVTESPWSCCSVQVPETLPFASIWQLVPVPPVTVPVELPGLPATVRVTIHASQQSWSHLMLSQRLAAEATEDRSNKMTVNIILF